MRYVLSVVLILLSGVLHAQIPTTQQKAVLAGLGMAHPWVAMTKSYADNPATYGDEGQHDLTMSFCDPANKDYWLRQSVDKFLPGFLTWIIDQDNFNVNGSREGGWYYPLWYHHCKEVMTAQEKLDCEAQIKKMTEFVLGYHRWGPVTRLGDSDTVIGHVALVRGTDKFLGTNYRNLIVSTAPGGTEWVGCSYAQMRAQLADIIVKSQGGELPESSGYNHGTSQLLILACASIGWEEFPEVQAWLPELAMALRWDITPNLLDRAQWGDEEHPHDLILRARIPLMMQVAALGGDADGKLKHLIAAMPPIPDNYFWNNAYRAMWVFDPSTLPAVPNVEHPVGIRSTAVGLTIYRTSDTLFQIFTANPSIYDHMMSQWDHRLWYRGDWIADHPIGYVPWTTNFNSGLVYGLEPMPDRKQVSAEVTSAGCKVVLETKGERYWPGYYDRPPGFLDMWRRTFELTQDPIRLKITDDVDVRQPTRLDRYGAGERYAIENSPPFQVIHHSPPGSNPTVIDGGFSWLSRAGTPVNITTNAPTRGKEQALIGTNIGSYAHLSEEGGYLMRLSVTPTPDTTGLMRVKVISELTIGSPPPAPPPPLPPDLPPPPPPAGDVQIADEQAAVYEGTWTDWPTEGFQGDLKYAAAGANKATWTFTVAPGTYRVATTWIPFENRATNASYTITGGTTPITLAVDQKVAPASFQSENTNWHTLGEVQVTGTSITVKLDATDANDHVIADAVRINKTAEPPPPPPPPPGITFPLLYGGGKYKVYENRLEIFETVPRDP